MFVCLFVCLFVKVFAGCFGFFSLSRSWLVVYEMKEFYLSQIWEFLANPCFIQFSVLFCFSINRTKGTFGCNSLVLWI